MTDQTPILEFLDVVKSYGQGELDGMATRQARTTAIEALNSSGSTTTSTASRTTSRAASSSALQSPGRSSVNGGCCSQTSRPAHSTR